MLNTLGIIATGAMMMFSPTIVEENTTFTNTDQITTMVVTSGEEDTRELVSFDITVDASEAELERIKTAAEEAGMGFTYKVRGVSKKKLVIDMVIENGEDYTMDRIIVTAADGVVQIQWEIDEDGQAMAFIDETTDSPITQNR